MVLQRETKVPVWGTARKDEKITVAFADQKVSTSADANGRWLVRLAPMVEGGPFEMVVSGDDTVRLTDVLVGEVWLCSGQSNMELAVERTTNAKEEIAAARYPLIRLFTVLRTGSESPRESWIGSWYACDSSSVRKFSGAADFFGRKLHQDLGIPIGLVHSSYGGTPAEAWMSKEALGSDVDFQPILDRWKKNVEEYPEKKKEFESNRSQFMQKWQEDSATATKAGKAPPAQMRTE